MKKPETLAQCRRLLQQRKVQSAPSPEYLEIMEILECGALPPAELVDRFLVNDRTLAFIRGRIVDWVLWRAGQGRPLRQLAADDMLSVALQAVHDTAVAKLRACWRDGDRQQSYHDVMVEDVRRLAHTA